jgi:acyl-CoA synthetase (NDP forming)
MVAKKASQFEALEIMVQAELDDPGVDAVLCILGVSDLSEGIAYREVAEKAAITHPDKPLVFYLYGSSAAEVVAVLEGKGKSMAFPSPDRAIRALGHLADYSEFRTAYEKLPL